ncbi:hypothetical protein [Myroides sp. LoEW2-1]|uniref:hypothetical protein n=1 Tax=Myroides sp. LoEW2-1 TaxID=2683192 RepID=UPI00132CAF7C|nr:hypothetical protein [Myroides sp. LoEW2-1]MVX37241.1 hypothetical protein [Myroides sp. LoEW2-1]
MKQSVSETVAKDILLEELEEQGHIHMVEDVIFWALEHYAESKTGYGGAVVANYIVRRIKEQEQKTQDKKRWSRG